MTHETRLDQAVRQLLREQRVAALGTLDANGHVAISMVPFAVDSSQGVLVIHVSQLAAHTGNMQRNPSVAIMVATAEVPGQPVHDLPRLSLQGQARPVVSGTAPWTAARASYLDRFPQAQAMTELADFQFVTIVPDSARHIAGFGAARTIAPDVLIALLSNAPEAP